ncbi:hypothetical protein FACS1894132_11260 [Clostridia bacterium]|nr:hypothetical protein FACS1894132_11260 [Clostridia bacterium]
MLETVKETVPQGATVLEIATGTGNIALSISDKASRILATDISLNMLKIARKKVCKQNAINITFAERNIYDIAEKNNSFDIVIASQVLHLLDNPNKASRELRRVANKMVILPMSFTKNLTGISRAKVGFYKIFGFSPKREFDKESYAEFLIKMGFRNCQHIQIDGEIPMAVAIWRKNG